MKVIYAIISLKEETEIETIEIINIKHLITYRSYEKTRNNHNHQNTNEFEENILIDTLNLPS